MLVKENANSSAGSGSGTEQGFQSTKNTLSFLLFQTSTLIESIDAIKQDLIFPPLSILSPHPQSQSNQLNHLEKIQIRIRDKRSKILITGDLNAGKSTLINTLLQRQVVPDDQEPCTAMFVEVIDSIQNNGIEEVHGVLADYDINDSKTYKKMGLQNLVQEVEDEGSGFELLKVYCQNSRQNSLLHNGSIDVSLIDSPGLNIDSMKTTSLFTKQQEIDVIVFVVNAENHFTLSAREFLQIAVKEKAFVFIVVNRFDSIRRVERNQRDILDQIKSISQSTFDRADDLVHFVSAKKVFQSTVLGIECDDRWVDGFVKLEEKLEDFILNKRMISKLAPAEFNITKNDDDRQAVQDELDASTPHYLELNKAFAQMPLIDADVIDLIGKIREIGHERLSGFINEFELFMESVEWNGISDILGYSLRLRQVVSKLASLRLKSCHAAAKLSTQTWIDKINLKNGPMIDREIELMAHQFELDAHVFASEDKLILLKEFIPSISLIILSTFSYQPLTTTLLKGGGRIVKLIGESKSILKNQTRKSISTYLMSTKFVERNSDEIVTCYSKLINRRVEDWKSGLGRMVDEGALGHLGLVGRREAVGVFGAGLRGLGIQAAGLQRELGAIKFQ